MAPRILGPLAIGVGPLLQAIALGLVVVIC